MTKPILVLRICNPQQSVCLSMHPECFYLVFLSLCYFETDDRVYSFKMKDKVCWYVLMCYYLPFLKTKGNENLLYVDKK